MEPDLDSIYSISTIATNTTITEHPNRRNILIVGDTGVGKSALVNLIAGEELAIISAGAKLCTIHPREYVVTLDGVQFTLHDTPGLHGSQGNMKSTDYMDPFYQAFALISRLQRFGGISLLVFCIKGGRISVTMQQTYNFFVEVLCNRQVPVVIIVTHLEMYDNMEDWWRENERGLNEYRLRSHGHACITTARGYKNIFIDKYEESRQIVSKLLLDHGNRVDWKEGKARWVKRVVLYLRTRLFNVSDLERKLVDQCGFSVEDAKLAAQDIAKESETTSGDVWEEEMLWKHSDISSCCISWHDRLVVPSGHT